MSVVVAKGIQITQSATNTSSSNQMYSFGIGKRSNFLKSVVVTDAFYDIPNSFSISLKKKKGFSLGKAIRLTSGTKKEDTVKSYYYKESSLLHPSQHTSFGRPQSSIRKINDISGYGSNTSINAGEIVRENPKPAAVSKTKRIFDIKYNHVPGPGQYNTINSSFGSKANTTSIFSKFTTKRFEKKKDNKVPGPIYSQDYNSISCKLNKLTTQTSSQNTTIIAKSSHRIFDLKTQADHQSNESYN